MKKHASHKPFCKSIKKKKKKNANVLLFLLSKLIPSETRQQLRHSRLDNRSSEEERGDRRGSWHRATTGFLFNPSTRRERRSLGSRTKFSRGFLLLPFSVKRDDQTHYSVRRETKPTRSRVGRAFSHGIAFVERNVSSRNDELTNQPTRASQSPNETTTR